jgi:hypothetical protein
MEAILHHNGIHGRSMSWETLGYEAGLDVSWRTIQRAMGQKDYRKCIACRKAWISPELGMRRKACAKVMLERYPEPED